MENPIPITYPLGGVPMQDRYRVEAGVRLHLKQPHQEGGTITGVEVLSVYILAFALD